MDDIVSRGSQSLEKWKQQFLLNFAVHEGVSSIDKKLQKMIKTQNVFAASRT